MKAFWLQFKKTHLAWALLALIVATAIIGSQAASFEIWNYCGSDMTIHCKSGDDDLGTLTITDQQHRGWAFGKGLTTLFWCNPVEWNGMNRPLVVWSWALAGDVGDNVVWKIFGYGFFLVYPDGSLKHVADW